MSTSIWGCPIPNSEELNSKLLKWIDSQPKNAGDSELGDRISNSDYYGHFNFKTDEERIERAKKNQEYYDILKPYFEPWFQYIQEYYAVTHFKIDGVWFHQYENGDQFTWHFHPESNISFVYFVELPDPSFVTEFFLVETKKVYQPPLKTGDMLVFPSYMPHRSPKITSNDRKTIISGNLSLYNVNLDAINYE